MPFQIIYYVLLLWVCSLIVYACYKALWYVIKMLLLMRHIKKIAQGGAQIEKRRSFFAIIFGERGKVDYVITRQNKRYAVSVVSFISTHGRWNVEKTRTRYYIESRRSSKIFYNRYVNSSAPDHVAEYKRELRLSRREFYVPCTDATFDERIFLLYPYPKRITYTDAQYHELYVGDKIEGHTIMDIQALRTLLLDNQ